MYEKLTAFLPKLSPHHSGDWIVDTENDGSPEHPMHFPFVDYDSSSYDFESAVHTFINDHKNLGLTNYRYILEKANIAWSSESMKSADVATLDGRSVMALIVGVIRADRFSEGTLAAFLESGKITEWLSRLKEIDESTR